MYFQGFLIHIGIHINMVIILRYDENSSQGCISIEITRGIMSLLLFNVLEKVPSYLKQNLSHARHARLCGIRFLFSLITSFANAFYHHQHQQQQRHPI